MHYSISIQRYRDMERKENVLFDTALERTAWKKSSALLLTSRIVTIEKKTHSLSYCWRLKFRDLLYWCWVLENLGVSGKYIPDEPCDIHLAKN